MSTITYKRPPFLLMEQIISLSAYDAIPYGLARRDSTSQTSPPARSARSSAPVHPTFVNRKYHTLIYLYWKSFNSTINTA